MLKFSGTVEGVKTEDNRNPKTGETWQSFYLGISEPKAGGYGDEKIIHDIKLTQKAMENGMDKTYQNLIGKKIEVEIFITARAWNNNAYMDWIISGEGRPISVDGKPAGNLKAA